MPLTPAAAAKRFLELKPQAAAIAKELKRCEDVLKERLAEGGTYRGVKCTVTEVTGLDAEAVKALLGKKAPMKTTKRRSLSPDV